MPEKKLDVRKGTSKSYARGKASYNRDLGLHAGFTGISKERWEMAFGKKDKGGTEK